MKTCIYCGQEKEHSSFSDEHIWPAALGGDFLPTNPWRTTDVCAECNSISGVYVDGEFIRSWFGKAELSYGSLDYLAAKGIVTAIPLDYLGQIQGLAPEDVIAEYWAGPCGANIVHIRPRDDGSWGAYAGGDPRAKRINAGRAYMALTTQNDFWILVSLASFKKHFDRAERFVTNMDIPEDWPFKNPDLDDPIQASDMALMARVIRTGASDRSLHSQVAVRLDAGNRMLAKMALAIGYKLFGSDFLNTEYAGHLRNGFREAKAEKRRDIPIRGSGFLNSGGLDEAGKTLSWPGGWTLLVQLVESKLALNVIAPTGRSMTVMVCDEPEMIKRLSSDFHHGLVWITVPAAGRAVGPISFNEYIAHKIECVSSPTLTELANRRGDPASLPDCSNESTTSYSI